MTPKHIFSGLSIAALLSMVLSIACVSPEPKPIGFAEVVDLAVPCDNGGEPFLHMTPSGVAMVSWVEYKNDTVDQLRFSRLEDHSWSPPQTIAEGGDWFVNWADFPSVVAYIDNEAELAAHWLQKSAKGTYDYDVMIAQSQDGGKSWQKPFRPHTDGVPAEHGFVSLLPIAPDQIRAFWLDGRYTKHDSTHTSSDHHHHTGGAMTLRTAIFDKNGVLSSEAELDARVCDCCQTSAAMTALGPVVVYRDRSESEVRDISIVRQVAEKWTAPEPVARDDWKIAGCPVNGPSISTSASTVAVAWFTMPADDPQVNVAFSSDNGATFQTPIRIDGGDPIGRVDIELISGVIAVVSWIEEKDPAAIQLVMIDTSGKVYDELTIATTSASRRAGFPRISRGADHLIMAWTQVDSLTNISSSRIGIEYD